MSLEVKNAQNIAKGIHSKNPIPPRKGMLKSKSKVRGKEKREVVEGEVIEPTPVKPLEQEPEVYDGTIVRDLPGKRKELTSAPRMVTSTRITPTPELPAPAGSSGFSGSKKRKPGYKQMTLPGMGRTAQFKTSAPPQV